MMRTLVKSILVIVITVSTFGAFSQDATISGVVKDKSGAVPFVEVKISGTKIGVTANNAGEFKLKNVPAGEVVLEASLFTYETQKQTITVKATGSYTLDFTIELDPAFIDEIVVTGTMKPVSKLESAVPIDVYTPKFFQKNPTPSVYEAMQNVNGVRPQVNCAVCNTGDIHINGLEGAYTMVMIDGMPIVSGLSTVYGLSGIPQSLIERIEIVKGPSSTLYGSEAVGGIINVITKQPDNAPIISADAFATSWGEVNADIATKVKLGENVQTLVGINYFNFENRIDNNNDNFTDLTLQDRISIFNKWNFKRKSNKVFSLAGRYVYEDRFGGEMDWLPTHRGGGDVYGESIYTSRWEVFGAYELPVKEKIMFMFSANGHNQNSVYGDTWYIADQRIGFGQMTWNKELGEKHDILMGAAMRYTYYDDNTPATATSDTITPLNAPTHTYLPGFFVQDEINFNASNKLLLGMRYDNNSLHGHIFTPRLNYKWSSKNKKNVVRLGLGTGYRVANVFTEDHAALTGSREVVFESELRPETSMNSTLNVVKKIYTDNDFIISLDGSLFYTYFNNKIFADYDTDPNLIVYDNIQGHAVSNGASLNIDMTYKNLKLLAGFTAMEVYSVDGGIKERQELTEQYTGTWALSYEFKKIRLSLDYTGNIYGPMELPTLGDNDPRPAQSPWWSIQNLQIVKKFGARLEIDGGVKNLLNWTPWKGMAVEMMARPQDPFDQNVVFDASGQAVATAGNPNGLTFDPAYVYGPNQGIRGFFGLRYSFDKKKK